MADRFWVGGTANWDGTAGTKWATTSGGAGGASVPTSADDVFFDAASTGTCTISTGNTGARSINCTGFTGTLAGSAAITVAGGVTLVAGMTWSYAGTVTVTGAATITSAGKTWTGSSINVTAPGFTVALGDAYTTTVAIIITSGTFSTNNFNLTAFQINSSNSNTRTINLGSSTATLSATGTAVNFSTNTNLTFNAGTSTITASGANVIFGGGGLSSTGVTFYNVQFTNTGTNTHQIQGINTFNNITVTAPASAGVTELAFNSRQTINGTLSTTGTAGNRRVRFSTGVAGIAQTLTINSAPSLTDADFQNIYVIGTAAPISGTRISNLAGCLGITFSTPKTVYWNLAGAQNWSANGWAATSTGSPSTDNFPLAQDTAAFTDAGSVTGTITMNSAIPYTGTVDMSGRTSAMTLSIATGFTIYGNWTNGSGTTISGTSPITFSGRNTQIITSAGRTFGQNGNVVVDSYGGTVELADALNIGSNALTVTNGTFDTKNYNVTAGSLSSSNSNVRTITLGSSTVTLSGSGGPSMNVSTNLTFNAGTSQINITAENINLGFSFGGLTYYNVTFTGVGAKNIGMATTATTTFNNLTITAPSSAGLIQFVPSGNFIINGTLTCAGATAVRRIFLRSDTLGTPRTLTVATLSATDCDFRDITIAGAAAGSSPTRAGDCGGNTGITFPAPKTVYWNLAGVQNWSATAWAPSSGGTPDINQFPLAQDTAVFDNTGSAGTVIVNAIYNIGSFNAGSRSSAWSFQTSAGANIYGDWTYGSGVTTSNNNNPVTFLKRTGTQTLTTAGKTFGDQIIVNSISGNLQLGDALTAQYSITLTSGTFDAVTYNVTVGSALINPSPSGTLKMGTGTWTLSGVGNVWNIGGTLIFNKGTANIVLSNTSTSARGFANNANLAYNKLTIGGTAGTSTLTFSGSGQFSELASTKTVAHTIDLGSGAQTFGKWTVTGTAGNVVTVSGTSTITIAGAAVTGVDYLALGTTTLSSTSPGEFFAGANSTGGTNFTLTAAPAARTLYWVGGTGNWSDTARWSTSSGGGGGAAVPTSLDNVIFDAASNATAYTATVNATSRCNQLTIAGPASGNVTLAGSSTLICHGNITLPATGLNRTFTGPLVLSGSVTGDTFTTNGVTLASAIDVNGVGCEWTLGSALNNGGSAVTVTNGSFKLSSYNLTAFSLTSINSNIRTVDLGSSTLTLTGQFRFGTIENERTSLTLVAGTSQVNLSSTSFDGNNQTYNNFSFTSTSAGTFNVTGANSFNNFSSSGITAAGLKIITLAANQTVTGTLTLSAGTDATMRHFVRSNTFNTTRTITAAAVSLTDADFRDITIAGAAAPASGTRLGDCKGNSGITFDATKTVYWNLAGNNNWSATAWATSLGGTPAVNNFPLAQDTAVFGSASPGTGTTTTINASYNIGTIDMSARTSNTMTLATDTTSPNIYGNWINGTGTTLTGTGTMTFAGRGSQTITSAGKAFTQAFTVNTPSGSVTLQDAFSTSNNVTIVSGTFDAAAYNFSMTGASATLLGNAGTSKTIAIGSGTWTLAGSSTVFNPGATANTTITGTGTISLTSASAKTFSGTGFSYTNITLNQGGAGALTISGNNTFKDITNTYKSTGAANITLGTTTQRVSQWTGAGEAGRLLTVQGSSASSPGTLILTSAIKPNVDYLTITGVRAYALTDTWYAGANSTNNGSLGWIFAAAPAAASTGNFFLMFWPT